jgi:hypothetical protein
MSLEGDSNLGDERRHIVESRRVRAASVVREDIVGSIRKS